MPPADPNSRRLKSTDYRLKIRQGPEHAKVASTKENQRERKPVDPPSIIELQINDKSDPANNWLQNPYLFMHCALWHATEDREIKEWGPPALLGQTTSSLHKLKDVTNIDGGFFVFADFSVAVTTEGRYRIKFTLFELLDGEVTQLSYITSEPFTVHSSRNFPGMSESTFLARSFGDQGCRIRIRQPPKGKGTKRNASNDAANARNQDNSYSNSYPQHGRNDSTSVPQSGQGPQTSMPLTGASSYGVVSPVDSNAYSTPSTVKRQRTSIADGQEGYERDQIYNRQYGASQSQQQGYNMYPARGQVAEYDPGQIPPMGQHRGYDDPNVRQRAGADSSLASQQYLSSTNQRPEYPLQTPMGYGEQYRNSPHTTGSPYGDMAAPRIEQPAPVIPRSSLVDNMQYPESQQYAGASNMTPQPGAVQYDRRTSSMRDPNYPDTQYPQYYRQPAGGQQQRPAGNVLPPLGQGQSGASNPQYPGQAYSVPVAQAGYGYSVPADHRLQSAAVSTQPPLDTDPYATYPAGPANTIAMR